MMRNFDDTRGAPASQPSSVFRSDQPLIGLAISVPVRLRREQELLAVFHFLLCSIKELHNMHVLQMRLVQ